MTSSSAPRPKRLSSSPFKQAPEAEIKIFEVDDRVSHDVYGLGKVVKIDSHAVTVDFGAQAIRITPPFAKLHHL
jgi:hypothetical protein